MAFPYNKTNSGVGPGGTRTGIEYDQDHQDHIDHNIPDDIGHYGQGAGSFLAQTTSQYKEKSLTPEDINNPPATLKEEIFALRGAIRDVKLAIDSGVVEWYDVPTFSSLSDTEFTVTDTTNEDVFTVNANNVSFSNNVMVLNCYEENTGSFFFLKCNSDSDGTPVTEFSIDQDGKIRTGGDPNSLFLADGDEITPGTQFYPLTSNGAGSDPTYQQINRIALPSLGEQADSASTYSHGGAGYSSVPGLSATITTSSAGRPVVVMLTNQSPTVSSLIGAGYDLGNGSISFTVQIKRDSTVIGIWKGSTDISIGTAFINFPLSISTMDTGVAADTQYVYTVETAVANGDWVQISNPYLIVYET